MAGTAETVSLTADADGRHVETHPRTAVSGLEIPRLEGRKKALKSWAQAAQGTGVREGWAIGPGRHPWNDLGGTGTALQTSVRADLTSMWTWKAHTEPPSLGGLERGTQQQRRV